MGHENFPPVCVSPRYNPLADEGRTKNAKKNKKFEKKYIKKCRLGACFMQPQAPVCPYYIPPGRVPLI